jgi:hypothetical protein
MAGDSAGNEYNDATFLSPDVAIVWRAASHP